MGSRSRNIPALVGVAATAALLIVLCAAPVAAGTGDYVVQVSADGRLSVRASGISLGAILRDIGTAARIEKLFIDPQVERTPVTVSLERVPVGEGVARILGEAAIPFAVWGTDDPRSMRVFAGNREFMEKASARAAAEERDRTPRAWTDADHVELLQPDDNTPAVEDDVERQQTLDALNAALAPRPQTPGSAVALPFPGPDGEPLMGTLGTPGQSVALPFPDHDGKPILASTVPSPDPGSPPSDPAMRALLAALAPRPKPKP